MNRKKMIEQHEYRCDICRVHGSLILRVHEKEHVLCPNCYAWTRYVQENDGFGADDDDFDVLRVSARLTHAQMEKLLEISGFWHNQGVEL